MTHDRAIQLAEAYVRMKRGARALEVLKDASAEDARTWLWRANALHDVERFEESAAAARTGLGLEPESSYLHHALARAEFSLLHLAEAESAIRESLRLDAHEAGAHSLFAAILVATKRPAEANAASQHALTLGADSSPVRGIDVYVKLATGRTAEAEELSRELLSDAPDDPAAHFFRGLTRARHADVRQAARHYREAARLEPDNRAYVTAARVSGHWLLWPMRLLGRKAWRLGTIALSASLFNAWMLNPGQWTYVWYVAAWLAYVVAATVALIHLPLRK